MTDKNQEPKEATGGQSALTDLLGHEKRYKHVRNFKSDRITTWRREYDESLGVVRWKLRVKRNGKFYGAEVNVPIIEIDGAGTRIAAHAIKRLRFQIKTNMPPNSALHTQPSA